MKAPRMQIRYRVITVLADAAAAVNEVCYEAAIKANRVQGWLVRHRAART